MQRDKHEKHFRTLFKTISWRVLATLTTMSIVYLFTGEMLLSVGVGAVEIVAKMILYYFHERIWNVLTWGTWSHPLSEFQITHDLTDLDRDIIREKLRELGYME